jgi:hypothetical protein
MLDLVIPLIRHRCSDCLSESELADIEARLAEADLIERVLDADGREVPIDFESGPAPNLGPATPSAVANLRRFPARWPVFGVPFFKRWR